MYDEIPNSNHTFQRMREDSLEANEDINSSNNYYLHSYLLSGAYELTLGNGLAKLKIFTGLYPPYAPRD